MARIKRQPDEVLYNQSHDYPIDGKGHSYNLKDVPRKVWDNAQERARVEKRSLRSILIGLLARYGDHEVRP